MWTFLLHVPLVSVWWQCIWMKPFEFCFRSLIYYFWVKYPAWIQAAAFVSEEKFQHNEQERQDISAVLIWLLFPLDSLHTRCQIQFRAISPGRWEHETQYICPQSFFSQLSTSGMSLLLLDDELKIHRQFVFWVSLWQIHSITSSSNCHCWQDQP